MPLSSCEGDCCVLPATGSAKTAIAIIAAESPLTNRFFIVTTPFVIPSLIVQRYCAREPLLSQVAASSIAAIPPLYLWVRLVALSEWQAVFLCHFGDKR